MTSNFPMFTFTICHHGVSRTNPRHSAPLWRLFWWLVILTSTIQTSNILDIEKPLKPGYTIDISIQCPCKLQVLHISSTENQAQKMCFFSQGTKRCSKRHRNMESPSRHRQRISGRGGWQKYLEERNQCRKNDGTMKECRGSVPSFLKSKQAKAGRAQQRIRQRGIVQCSKYANRSRTKFEECPWTSQVQWWLEATISSTWWSSRFPTVRIFATFQVSPSGTVH